MAKSHLQKLQHYLRPHYGDLLWGTITLLLVNILGTYIPWLVKDVVDDLQNPQVIDRIGIFALAIIGLSSLMWAIRMVSRLLLFGVGRKVEYQLKQQVFEHLLTLPNSYFANHSAGEIISIVTNDVENIRRLLGFAILSLINTIFAYALTLPAMFLINWRLSLLAIAVYPLMFILVQSFSGQLRDEQLQVQEELAEVSSLLQEDLNGMALIKTYAQEEYEQQVFAKLNDRLLQANLQMAKTRNIIFPLLGGIASISFLVLLWFGGQQLAQKSPDFGVGDLLTLIIYIERLIFPTALLGFVLTTYQRGQVSIDRVEEILAMPPAIDDLPHARSIQSGDISGKVVIKDLHFTYPDSDRPALNGVNATIEAGETVAIIGAVGAGKTTLANALMRLIDVPKGTIFIDDLDITEIKIADLRQLITFVPQDSFLFSETIANNIRYGKPIAPLSEVEFYADKARIQAEILNFPKQYDTIVGERGITLSGGQRQRTALGRSLLVSAPILLLDDALASVDNQTALDILAGLPKNKTVIFISHNLSVATHADRILLMDQGKVIAEGSHRQLLETSGLYQQLWRHHQLEEILR
jgi:ATP-binding cassette subfamily B multidrug efflux pump